MKHRYLLVGILIAAGLVAVAYELHRIHDALIVETARAGRDMGRYQTRKAPYDAAALTGVAGCEERRALSTQLLDDVETQMGVLLAAHMINDAIGDGCVVDAFPAIVDIERAYDARSPEFPWSYSRFFGAQPELEARAREVLSDGRRNALEYAASRGQKDS